MALMNSTFQKEQGIALQCERVCLYDASKQENHFCHHAHICAHDGKLYAMWSNGRQGEGEIGQQVLYAVSEDGLQWSAPMTLLSGLLGPNTPLTLVPAGWLSQSGHLVAYVGAFHYAYPQRKQMDGLDEFRYGVKCVGTRLLALTSADGLHWSEPIDLNVPLCPNMGPQRLQSGRLLITGNWAHAYSDDPTGLSGWNLTSFCTDGSSQPTPLRDDPSAFWEVSRNMGYHVGLCEGAFVQTSDGAIHMLHRSNGPWLYESISLDNAETWSQPVRTPFSDGNSKFFLGCLPDGSFCYIGNPVPGSNRCPLVLSLSADGLTFDRHYLLETTPVPRKYPGVFKNGMYAYPHAAVFNGALYVVYTLWKEDVYVQKIPLTTISAEF